MKFMLQYQSIRIPQTQLFISLEILWIKSVFHENFQNWEEPILR